LASELAQRGISILIGSHLFWTKLETRDGGVRFDSTKTLFLLVTKSNATTLRAVVDMGVPPPNDFENYKAAKIPVYVNGRRAWFYDDLDDDIPF